MFHNRHTTVNNGALPKDKLTVSIE